ncbi:MAG TPA: hypothetical protein DCQ06_07400 [Myxococcales bacterium]|nr:hypothetical protein [Myxococcales bacterium]HAN31407.1 hypothetical protein [Myxococcales bacterium]
MNLHTFTLPELVVMLTVALEVVIVIVAIIGLLVLRRRAIRRERLYDQARDELSSLVELFGTNEEQAAQDRALAVVRRLNRDSGRRLLVEIGEFLTLEHVKPLVVVFTRCGFDEDARADAGKRPWERLRVVREARALGDPAGLLSQLLDDDKPDVKLGVFEALCAVGRPEQGIGALDFVATYGRLARMRVIDSLASSSPMPVDMLRQMAISPVSEVRLIAVGALGRAGVSQALDAIIDAATDTDVEVRIEALRALKELGDLRALPVSIASLKDEFWEVRSAACGVVGELGGDGAAQHLEPLLDDHAEWVRHNAALSLRECGPAGISALRQASAEGNESAGSALAEHRIVSERA